MTGTRGAGGSPDLLWRAAPRAVTLGPRPMAFFGKGSPSPPENEPSRHEIRPTYLGPKVRVQGELGGDEEIVFDGQLEGRVDVAKGFRVGPAGKIRGEVRARVVSIAGHVAGDVFATERVEILPTGVLEGNIRAPKIAIAEGATFKGSVEMGGRPGSPAPPGGAGAR